MNGICQCYLRNSVVNKDQSNFPEQAAKGNMFKMILYFQYRIWKLFSAYSFSTLYWELIVLHEYIITLKT